MTVDDLRQALAGVPGSLQVCVPGYESGCDPVGGGRVVDVVDPKYGKEAYWFGKFEKAEPEHGDRKFQVFLIGGFRE